MKKVVATTNAPAAIGPYSQGIVANGFVYTAGQLPVDPATGEMPEDIAKQTEITLKNVAAVLEAAGSSLDKAVKITVFVKDINDFDKINEVYKTFFKDKPPVRSLIQAARLPRDVGIEIECVALA